MTTKDGELRTSVKIKESTIKGLKKIGVMHETYDDVISRLVKLYNGGTIKDLGEDPDYLDEM